MRGARMLALIGCGYWGRNLARVAHGMGALSVICDKGNPQAEALARGFGVDFTDDIAALWRDDRVKAVLIASPAETHAEIATAALRAGRDAFVEKPLALSVADATAVAELAEAGGRVLMVGHLLRYHPVFQRLLQVVRAGDLGRLRYVYSNRLNIGKVRVEENVLWSFAPHDLSMILALAGERPDSVSCVGKRDLHPNVADHTMTQLAFPDGLRAHVFVSWLHPFKEQKLVVVGETGMLVFDDTEAWERKLMRYRHGVDWKDGRPEARKAEGEPVPVDHAEPLAAEIAHFLGRVADRGRPLTDGREGIAVLETLDAAQRSMDSGGVAVNLSPERTAAAATYYAHPTAVVDAGAEIGPGTKIWHYSHVLSGSRIGARVVVGQNGMIGPDVTIGDGCKLQNNVSVYKGVTLEADVFCGPSMVFTNVLTPRAHIERKDEFAPTLVRRGATLGANCVVVCGVTIGEYAMVGAGAVVTRDVPAYALVVGNPARFIGWVGAAGERLGDDLVCPRTGARYKLVDGALAPA
ncbi:MAG: Gfo/Idh/MocA family oxidoreductase [Rhodospirillales bacterium]|nr:MAG: Gfo/Idh/MocA family oxidoreductase [Rhodospirillales bacterium]